MHGDPTSVRSTEFAIGGVRFRRYYMSSRTVAMATSCPFVCHALMLMHARACTYIIMQRTFCTSFIGVQHLELHGICIVHCMSVTDIIFMPYSVHLCNNKTVTYTSYLSAYGVFLPSCLSCSHLRWLANKAFNAAVVLGRTCPNTL